MKTIKIKPTNQASALDTTVRLKLKSPYISNELIIKVTKPAQQSTFEPQGNFMWQAPNDLSSNTDLYTEDYIIKDGDGLLMNEWLFTYAYYEAPGTPTDTGSNGTNVNRDFLYISEQSSPGMFILACDDSNSTGGTSFNLRIIEDAIVELGRTYTGKISYKSGPNKWSIATFEITFRKVEVPKNWIDLNINYPMDMPNCRIWLCHPGLFGQITQQSQLDQLNTGPYDQFVPDTNSGVTISIPLPQTINGSTAGNRLSYTGEIDIFIYVSFNNGNANDRPNCTSLYIPAGAINTSYDVNFYSIQSM